MGDSARQIKRMEMELADAPPRLTEDNHRDILVRLPAKDVLRCGTVCKAWRLITADRSFLADNAQRQKAEVFLYTYVPRQLPRRVWASNGRWEMDVVLDAVVVSGDLESRRSLIRYRKPHVGGYLLLAVCDGVLLLKKKDGVYILCNPTTRKWADLPQLQYPDQSPGPTNVMLDDSEFAFYFHQQSGEYRLLCRQNATVNTTWCILSTGQVEPRSISTEAADAVWITMVVPCLRQAVTAPLVLHGNLHWPPHPGSIVGQTKMMVFDIVSEAFSQIKGPPTTTCDRVKLFIMDGILIGADFGQERRIDLWFLENYGNAARWELRHQVDSPWGPYSTGMPLDHSSLLGVAAAGDEEGNVMLGNNHGLVVYNVRKKQTVKTIDSVEIRGNNNVVVSRHVFKASLVQHPQFSTRTAADLRFVRFEDCYISPQGSTTGRGIS